MIGAVNRDTTETLFDDFVVKPTCINGDFTLVVLVSFGAENHSRDIVQYDATQCIC